MADFSIRSATEADVPAIAAIYGDAVLTGTASFELDPPSEAEMLRRFASLAEGGFPYLVAEKAGAVLGYGYAGPYRPRIAYRHTIEDSVYLAKEARGRGVGSALLRELVRASEKRGFRQMIAVIGDSGHEASIRLHQSAGFALVGTFKDVGYKFGRWLDTVLMQRALGPGGGAPPNQSVAADRR
jgi:phosphinothricin acetyltransferase